MISVNKRIKAGSVLAAVALVFTACSSSSKSAPTTAASPSTAASTTTGAASTATSTTTAGSTATTGGSTPTSGSTATTGSTPATGGSTPTSGSTVSTGSATTAGTDPGVTTAGISAARCAANKAAGQITYISSFDFSASASIIDVSVAKKRGYFDKMCLNVVLKPGFSTTNYPLVAAGTAQFSSAGNYTEILNNSGSGAEFEAVVDYGKTPIEALLTPAGGATTLAALKGKTIGVKGDLPPSIVAMLAKAGLKRGTDYQEIQLKGFDPVAQLSSGIDALPVYKSNEPGQLDTAGIKYQLFDPITDKIPGSFGLIYTSKQYAKDHPTVVADFARAALRGMQDALADIPGAVAISVDLINGNGNANFLTSEGETYRWTQESKTVTAGTPAGEPIGLIDPALLSAEYSAYVDAGVWPKGAPVDGKDYDASIVKALSGSDGKVVWPSS